MHMFLAGILIVVFFGWVFWQTLKVMGTRVPRSSLARVLLLGGALLTALLLARPDEELEAGEDAAAYFNAARSFLRHNAFHFSDPALAEIEPAERPLFRYGTDAFLITKDHTLWAKDGTMDPVGVFFFPAYSLLLGVPMGIGFSYGAFLITSLVAALTGILLAVFAARLTASPVAGGCAYLLFLLHPAVAWNARSLRAEWPASFLVLAGAILWLLHVSGDKRLTAKAGLASGLALGAAILFHMTAVYVLAPALGFSIILSRRERFWAGWWTGVALALTLFAAQTAWVTDPYWLIPLFTDPARARLPLLAGGVLLALGFGARALLAKYPLPPRSHPVLGLLAALLFAALTLYTLRYRDDVGRLPGMPEWTAAYISLTDFQGVARVMSRAWLLLAVVGLVPLCVRSNLGRGLFLLLAPASLTIGWVVNYMFETRRMVTFLVPLLILGTVCLVAEIARRCGRFRPWVTVALAMLPVIAAVRGRDHIYTTWNLRRTHGYYRSLSARIQPEADFLFAEYTQPSAPIERFTGLPTLPFAWEYREEGEARAAEAVWSRLVAQHPDRRHVVIAPFEGVSLPGVGLEPLFTETYHTRRMGRARRDIPRETHRASRTLHATRLLPPGTEAPRVPHVRTFFGSRMGIRGDANRMGGRRLEFTGLRMNGATSPSLDFTGEDRVFLLLAFPRGRVPETFSILPDAARQTRMGNHWLLVDFHPGESGGVEIASTEPTYLAQAFSVTTSGAAPLKLPGSPEMFGLEPIDSQWILSETSLAVPLHPGESWIWVLATHGRGDDTTTTTRLSLDGEQPVGDFHLGHGWHWQPVRMELDASHTGATGWLHLQTSPPHNPGLPDFPDNLGLRVNTIGVVPSESE